MGSTVQYGSNGPDVLRLQELLNRSLHHCNKLRVDGKFGALTEVAVRLYQTTAGIGIDGIAGPVTWAALEGGIIRDHAATVQVPADVIDSPWMTVATQEIGQTEIRGPQHNPRILEYHASTVLRACNDETAWCSSFVNWCLRHADIIGTNSAAASSWLHWGKASPPKTGAITIIYSAGLRVSASGYHVAFFLRDTGSHYSLLGGNQSGRVKTSLFPKASWRIVGCRWPIK